MTRMLTVGLVWLILVAAVLALVWAGQRRLIYFPHGNVPAPADVGLANAEPVTFTTEDGIALHAWYVPGLSSPPACTVLVFNGNAGNRAYRAPLAEALRARGASVLLLDYRGFGENVGTPTETGLEADARAARTYLLGRPDVDPSRLVYFGESLGAAVALTLAVEHPPAALILRSPFASMTEIGRFHYPILPVRWLLRDRFDSIGRIGRLRSPLLVIAGSRDGIVPTTHSQRLYDAAPEPKALVIIQGAEHNDLALLAGEEMMKVIGSFLARHNLTTATSSTRSDRASAPR